MVRREGVKKIHFTTHEFSPSAQVERVRDMDYFSSSRRDKVGNISLLEDTFLSLLLE